MRRSLLLSLGLVACGPEDSGEAAEERLIFEVVSIQCSSEYHRAGSSIRLADSSCGAAVSSGGTLTSKGTQTLDSHFALASSLAHEDWETCSPVDGTDVIWHFDDGTTLAHCASPDAPAELAEATAFMDAIGAALISCTDSEDVTVRSDCVPLGL